MNEADDLDDGDRKRFASSCAGKEQHVSETAALASASLGRAAMTAYLCEFGDHWHLASIPGFRRHTNGGDNGRGLQFEKLHSKNHHERHPRRRRREADR